MTLPFAATWRALGCVAVAAAVYATAPPPDALRAGLGLYIVVVSMVVVAVLGR